MEAIIYISSPMTQIHFMFTRTRATSQDYVEISDFGLNIPNWGKVSHKHFYKIQRVRAILHSVQTLPVTVGIMGGREGERQTLPQLAHSPIH